ncbi:GGDEF domain-containing protein [Legionella saoudiensis]|uniref:GGDEF domain-containing protein n=1 Tax=Legionella saoudiensis TaxID=1750561 RepID=UPI000730DEC7|nr:sensor domain-containing diguanylate cyclase [Legionella saoudiensis]
MPEAPYLPNEEQRLAAVQKSQMLGTPAEERFDKITRLARRIFNVPLAVIDILGAKVAWVKSAQGVSVVMGVRKDSYCHHTILDEEICVTFDARKDPRFFDSIYTDTWVFYAGVPIHFEGERIGVFCIGDNKPRRLSLKQQETLRDLASLVEQELNFHALSEAQVKLAQQNEELERKSRIDPLTHSWNRAAIFDILAMELRNIQNNFLAILMIDIDCFKEVNDTYGHPAGDEVLNIIVEKIRAVLRPKDALGRYGGDEFLAVLANIELNDALRIGQQICDEVAGAPISFNGGSIHVTCSIGCAISANLEDINLLIKHADEALYQAKGAGRGNIGF